uniref:Uncharacterized protein n=1 Tax=Rhizophora mucronata TaxID=61149 RepID=A0A2P2NN20_RHIMU
MRITFAKQSVV